MSELRFRGGRSLALAAGIVVAAVTFTLLTAQTRASALHVRGTIAGSYRTAYDILVRPSGTRTALERRRGLVRANYLSGIVGGFSFAQYRTVQRIRGVAVAATVSSSAGRTAASARSDRRGRSRNPARASCLRPRSNPTRPSTRSSARTS